LVGRSYYSQDGKDADILVKALYCSAAYRGMHMEMTRYGTETETRGYELALADGSRWWLSSDAELGLWLAKWARIMELDESAWSGSSRLLFSFNGKAKETRPTKVVGQVCNLSKTRQKGQVANLSYGHFALSSVVSKEAGSAAASPWQPSLGPSGNGNHYEYPLLRFWFPEGQDDVFCEIKDNGDHALECINMWLACLPLYQRSVERGGVPFHGALIEWAGQGVLLAAPGDTGKSTCCRRLPRHWTAWGDDESLVVLDPQGTYRAHPFPTWSEYLEQRSEKTWPVQDSVPLAGIFFLEQAPTDEAIPVGQGQAAFLMSDSAAQVGRKFWAKLDQEFETRFRRALFDNASRLARRVPAFRLRCSREGKFWEEIERVLVRSCTIAVPA